MVARRTLAIWGNAGMGAAGALLVWGGAVMWVVSRGELHAAASLPWLALGYALAVAWGFAFTLRYWRRIDEVAREGQKAAWFIGSIAAIIFTAPPMLYLRGAGAPQLAELVRSPDAPGVWFGLGWSLLAVGQVIGFLIAWGAWWLARSRPN